jgi:D-glycero-alpha-D-manno-heptose-7-phosphate kinase
MIITKTPLRVSLLGGGSDFPWYFNKYEGDVINFTIDKYITVIVNGRFDNKIRLGYTRHELVDSVDEIQHELIRECLRKVGIESGIELITMADIPGTGSGLGSSSALTVGVLNALYNYIGKRPLAYQLAEEAVEIETEIVGNGAGWQDQYAASYGGLNEFGFSSRGVSVKAIELAGIESLLLYFTGKTRRANSLLSGMAKLRNYTAIHLAKELVGDCGSVNLGELLHRGWQIKKEFAAGVTNLEIDIMYQTAVNAGATGGKVCGAGGGGFMLLYVEENRRESVKRAMRGYQELGFSLVNHGSHVIYRGQPNRCPRCFENRENF